MTKTMHADNHPVAPDAIEAEERTDPVVHLLESVRIAVREGFAEGVLARLPDVSWSRRRVPWGLVAACTAVVMMAVATILVSGSDAGSGVAAVDSLVELLATGLMAGAGMLAATWGGLRTTVGGALRESPGTTLAVSVLLIGAAFALVRLVGQRREAMARSSNSRDDRRS